MDRYNREWCRNRVLVMQLAISSDSEESEEEQSAASGGSETKSSSHLVEEEDGGDVSCRDSPDSHSDFATSDDAFTSSDSDCDYISSEDNIVEGSSIDVVYQGTERPLENNLKMKLRNWATKTHQTRESINEMLSIFRDEGYELPKDAWTLLRTPQSISTVSLCCGSYSYFGIERAMRQCLTENECRSAINVYGSTFPVHNVHSLVHLPDDAAYFSYSLNEIKKKIAMNMTQQQLKREMIRTTEEGYLSKDLEQNLNMDGQRGAKTAFRGSSLHVLRVESVLEKFSSTVTE
ncbi:hypothetical protein CAPTEDRAFT_208592 [Capitella teleta]|uniref:Uncharacterized protein n=1 Tax=Capitella teleta TaxID=283909 RepID=R7UHG6_CAPTE|nr:hypothetical protein CAPTEDRAFT_208592 [Capitella teleta]|eukprot:ELU05984.1 hypothetical protein CAPTEDRAFT_208592 [Capitella teleta]